ncbi:MAG TPA: LysM domain-containing protein [Steroidobacteraceae bacterium]|nr:LysM domain-containing protein [Steroidobacteraceae bacterium]
MKRVDRMKTPDFRWPRSCAVALCASAIVLGAGFGVAQPSAAQSSGARTMPSASEIPLAANAPDRYVVQRGDTLWDISRVFLRDPWFWPEIWYVNPQVENPHLIYPGDVLTLVYVDGRPQIRLERGAGTERLSPRIREQPLDEAITAIPYDVIAAFMRRPTVLDRDQVRNAPYIVAMRDGHLIAGAGNEIYARGIGDASVDERFSIVHVGRELRDPDDNALLGYRGLYVGAGPVLASGDPAKLLLTESDREALQGDKVFPETIPVGSDFVPRPPAGEVTGTIIAVDGVAVVGQYQVIAINRGDRHGLEPGSVLAIYEAGEMVRDVFAHGGLATRSSRASPFEFGGTQVQLPDERVGLAMVFHAYDRMSYALIMESQRPISVGDRVSNP